jgi:hypothetical protein
MKTQRTAIVLIVLNLLVLVSTFFRGNAAVAPDVAPILRGRALELVDEHGRVRAEIKVHPADPNVKMPDGTKGYPESVLLRLIDSKGGPNVKIGASEDGAGISLANPSGYIQILNRGTNLPFIKIVTTDGRERKVRTED